MYAHTHLNSITLIDNRKREWDFVIGNYVEPGDGEDDGPYSHAIVEHAEVELKSRSGKKTKTIVFNGDDAYNRYSKLVRAHGKTT